MTNENEFGKKLTKNVDISKRARQTPKLINMIQESSYMNMIYENVAHRLRGQTNRVGFLNKKENIKYETIGISVLFAILLISTLSFFMFSMMFTLACLKCMLWLLEEYNPEKKESKQSEEALEYMIIPIFVVLLSYPFHFAPMPMLSLGVHVLSVMLGLACITDREYRRKFCVFVRNLLISKHSKDKNGAFIKGSEGEFHRLLQILMHLIECICVSTFNLTHNPGYMIEKINDAIDLTDAMMSLTTQVTQNEIMQRELKRSRQVNNTDILHKKEEDSDINSTSSDIMSDEFD